MFENLSPLDILYRGSLATVNNKFIVILIVLFGYIFLKREAFGRTFLIFAFAQLLNPFLKSLFQVPLPPASGLIGWAFPSGHMFVATIFWGWLCWECKNKYLCLWTALLLTCMGFALVHYNYHYPSDIVGALFFASLTLIAYFYLNKLSSVKSNPPMVGFILTLIGLILLIFTVNTTLDSSRCIAFIVLLGFSLGWLLNNKFYPQNNLVFQTKIVIFIFSILGLVILETVYHLTHTTIWPIKFVHYFIIALWLTLLAPTIVLSIFKPNRIQSGK